MSSPFCVIRCDCEECEDKNACDVDYKEKGFRLLESGQEEDWHERRHAEKENL